MAPFALRRPCARMREAVRSDQGVNPAFSVRPEPTPAERDAIARALAEASVPGRSTRGAWWHAGVRENVAVTAGGAD
jgi:hypothetical protein